MTTTQNHPNVIEPENSLIIIIDFQENYRSVLYRGEQTIERARILIEAASIMNIPVLYTEQYPKGLGPTCSDILNALPKNSKRFEKGSCSIWKCTNLPEWVVGLGKKHVIVSGIETHVCVNQSVHDLINQGYTVHLPVDALTSRSILEHEQGLEKMFLSGALPATVEQVLFELVQTNENIHFHEIRQLIK